ncbi:Tod6p KNAG_0B02480 [Huiozyma naganishii CBS 8797]|uniref:Myb-like domain-containing protein n=1 Tax=Huiozyma naganishii (strain ATCC MYA-139 / BCRC 22969 / CBS 8797 / KCTC 17520 / NBRC 10181 / NCYC 3082 / Yp74L-3) TaxID=1071383 RepID=J7S3F3_HUIN7|nr:hypothetical protein KNAG_0B02480 [Kazachstania naganishii CBS 8797]CCK68689.1 hypothetical protein KNAG_0B02480 [Kazachstania naganishii CBS 8797]
MPAPKSAAKNLSAHNHNTILGNSHPHPHKHQVRHQHTHHSHPHQFGQSGFHTHEVRKTSVDATHLPGLNGGFVKSEREPSLPTPEHASVQIPVMEEERRTGAGQDQGKSLVPHTTATIVNSDENSTKDNGANGPSTTKNPSSWDPQDDLLLRHLKEVKRLGWKDISLYFKNRTPNACQFRWRRLKSGNLKSNKTALVDVTDLNIMELKSPNIDLEYLTKNSGNLPSKFSVNIPTPPIAPLGSAGKAQTSFNRAIDETNKPHYQRQNTPDSDTTRMSPPRVLDANSSPGKLASGMHTILSSASTSNSNGKKQSEAASGQLKKSYPAANTTKFVKPRSFSHSATRPNLQSQKTPHQHHHKPQYRNVFPTEEENIGFVPKIIVRSRRSSLNPLQLPNLSNLPQDNFMHALNTTLTTMKSRKNSFVYSRRSSFNLSSVPTSRRSSFNLSSTNTSRRSSIVTPAAPPPPPSIKLGAGLVTAPRKDFMTPQASYMDSSLRPTREKQHFKKWSKDEDDLLLEVNSKKFTLKELSIVLGQRSEEEIQWRFNHLNSRTNTLGSHDIDTSSRHSKNTVTTIKPDPSQIIKEVI